MTDCWRRCIAKLTGMAPEWVPDFVNDDPDHWLQDTSEWLRSRGLALVALVNVGGDALAMARYVTPKGPYIAVGSIGGELCHAVVHEADGTVWDPMQGCVPLQNVCAVYWVADG